ncbi:Heme A synthase, cytochrome oxidase biogenesis protein Cox15-CtaA [hydrothermal vent metagenome]|uniref:Heme A synthase, cytochrome oxidase biogenesis protein Cox15-CtaA n=1 Tax=hydrothermal vent metagenome TaxID=652676 RepID=A0A3B0RUJ6_9ZZZZ
MSELTEKQRSARPAIRAWLYFVAILIFAMVIVGGATRLTDSGLSITEWKPLLGAIPPLNEADWMAAFNKYRQIPEYTQINKGMSLAEFQFIYWWEWSHRFLGRFIGLAFAVPALFFWLTGRLEKPLRAKTLLLFVLGGLQGALGWYMVKSGLVDRVDVSQYRLAAHLTLAVVIFAAILWIAFGIGREQRRPLNVPFGPATIIIITLIFLQVALGGFVAGLDAGQGYNTWPLMDGAIIPDGLAIMSPWWKNLFENAMTVQFNHRVVAYIIVLFIFVHSARQMTGECRAGSSALALLIVAFTQMALGIVTLLYQVPIDLALAHQGGALVLLASALWHLHDLCLCGSKG